MVSGDVLPEAMLFYGTDNNQRCLLKQFQDLLGNLVCLRHGGN
jgi:hypothetical protein